MSFAFTPKGNTVFAATDQNAPVVQAIGGQVVNVNGVPMCAVPTTLQHTQALWAGGIYVPGPIQNPAAFSWPSVEGYVPMHHQRQTSDFMSVFRRTFCLNTPGTGKTSSALWTSEFLLNTNQIDVTVIFCPLSCVEDVWIPELKNVCPLRNVSIAHGKNKLRAVKGPREYIVVNHDGVSNQELRDALVELQRTKRVFVIVDEANAYKNWSAARTRNMAKISNDLTRTRMTLMTGTPHPKDPTDIYGMCRVRDPKSIPSAFGAWRNKVMYNPYGFKWVPKDNIGPDIQKAMHPAICFEGKDCIDLPPRYDYGFGHDMVKGSDFESRGLTTTPDQDALIALLKKEAYAMLQAGELTVAHAGVLRTKMFQILQGVVKLDNGAVHEVDCTPRINDMLRCLSHRRKRFLVFCNYKAVQHRVKRVLDAQGIRVEIVNGDVSKTRRTAIFKQYKLGEIDGIIGHPGTMAHGLNLTEGDVTYWWGPPDKPDYFDQGNHRQYRNGQKDSVHIFASAAGADEAAYFDVLLERGDLEKATRAMFTPK